MTEPSIPILFFADEILGIHPYDWQCRILLTVFSRLSTTQGFSTMRVTP
jgi:hypothetical protein